MPSKEQNRSAFALKKIGDHVDKETANFIVGTPTMIQTNGLAQMMAFIKSKDERKHQLVFNAVSEWIHICFKEDFPNNNERAFFGSLVLLNQTKYLAAQEEALLMLQWLKRYARAFEQ